MHIMLRVIQMVKRAQLAGYAYAWSSSVFCNLWQTVSMCDWFPDEDTF